MLHDILLSLLGFPGDIIVQQDNTFSVRQGFALLQPAEKEQVNRIVPLGWYHNELQSYVDAHEIQWKLNENVNKRDQSYQYAYALAISDLLAEYCEDIAYLEQFILMEGPVPLSYLYQYLQKYLIVMPFFHDITSYIVSKEMKGCQILDYLSSIRSGVPVINDVLKRILYHVRIVFVKQSLSWSLYGQLDDSGNEFMIHRRSSNRDNMRAYRQNSRLSQSRSITADVISRLESQSRNLKESAYESPFEFDDHTIRSAYDESPFDWLSSYYLRVEFLPESHVSIRLASKILFCGKAIKLLHLATKEKINQHSYSFSERESEAMTFSQGLYNYFTQQNSMINANLDHSNKAEIEIFQDNDKRNTVGMNLKDDLRLHMSDSDETERIVTNQLQSNGFHQKDLLRFNQKHHILMENLDRSFEYFDPLISDIHDVLSKKLWFWLKHDMRFISFLSVMRNIYLLGRGEFFQLILDQILDICTDYSTSFINNQLAPNRRLDVSASIADAIQADVILDEILQAAIKTLGHDDNASLNLIAMRVCTSQYMFPPSRNSRTHFRDNYSLEANLNGTAKYKEVKNSGNGGFISLCSCDEVIQLADDIEDYYLHGLMIKPDTEEDDDEEYFRERGDDNTVLAMAANLPLEYYVNGSLVLSDQRYIVKGFTSSFVFSLDWNAVTAKLTSNHACFLQKTSLRPYASPLRHMSKTKSPHKRLRSVCLGSVSLTLHNDRQGSQTIGSGALGVDGVAGSISIGVSFHARLTPKDGATSADDLEIRYQLRVYVSHMHHSAIVRDARSVFEDTSSLRPDESMSKTKTGMVSNRGYHYDILEDRYIDVNFCSPDIANGSAHEHDASSTNYRSINGLEALKCDIEYFRDISTQSPRASSNTIMNTSIASLGSRTSYLQGNSLQYIIRARIITDSTSKDFLNQDHPWDIQFPVDISKYLRLQGGQAFISYTGSSLDLNEHQQFSQQNPIDSPIRDISNGDKTSMDNTYITTKSQAFSSCLGIDIYKIVFDSKGALASYPVASTYTSSRFPETTLKLESQVSKFRLYMNIKLKLNFPETFRVVMDSESTGCYERIYSMLMKVRMVGNALEKLWLTKSRLSTERSFCHLRHSMLFFISNLLYYLQVDVIDSEFSILMEEVESAVDMQAVLKSHRNFLATVARSSFIDNISVQESIDRIMQVCLRFLSIFHLVQQDEKYPMDDSAMGESFTFQMSYEDNLISPTSSPKKSGVVSSPSGLNNLMNSILNPDYLPKTGSIAAKSLHKLPIIIPTEELDAVRKEFFTQVSFLFHLMSKVDNKGFMFRLDFNGYLSQVVAENINVSGKAVPATYGVDIK